MAMLRWQCFDGLGSPSYGGGRVTQRDGLILHKSVAQTVHNRRNRLKPPFGRFVGADEGDRR
jgi:hypothetical protein